VLDPAGRLGVRVAAQKWFGIGTILAGVLAADSALAADFQVDGLFRARSRMFDTLSLVPKDNPSSEGFAWNMEHRFWIRPKILLNEHVGVFADIRMLDGVSWGSQQYQQTDFVTGTTIDTVYTDVMDSPDTTIWDGPQKPNIAVWRAWGEVHGEWGSFKFGRQPLDWGMGIWQNAGTGLNQDYGDSADRLSYEASLGGVWLRAAVDIHTEGLINKTDDTTSYSLAAAYRSEQFNVGLQAMYRRRAYGPGNTLDPFGIFTVDLHGDLTMGPVFINAEFAGNFGGGDLEGGFNDINVLAFGGALDIGVQFGKIKASVLGGFATGDKDEFDDTVKTFTFDRDFNIGLFMFEQILPTMGAITPTDANFGRDYSQALTGPAISNALFLKPAIMFAPVEDLDVGAYAVFARPAVSTEANKEIGRTNYGYEVGASLQYKAYNHFIVGGRAAAFIPATYYSNFTDDNFEDGFSRAAFGGELILGIEF